MQAPAMLLAQLAPDPTNLAADPRWTLLAMTLVWIGHQAGKLIDWYIASHGQSVAVHAAETPENAVQAQTQDTPAG